MNFLSHQTTILENAFWELVDVDVDVAVLVLLYFSFLIYDSSYVKPETCYDSSAAPFAGEAGVGMRLLFGIVILQVVVAVVVAARIIV